VTGTAAPRAAFRDVFAVREFRALWFSEILSVAGDRLALVALTLLVYDRTRSPLLTALAYASGYLPWIIGGLFLAGLADRYPRRAVMVTCDLARAVLVAVMVIPGVPIAGLVGLLFAATAFAPPFDSSRAALTPDILPGDLYPLGASVTQTTFLAAQVAGVAVAGVAVEVIGVRPALAIDAATFVLSGLLIGFGTRVRPAAATPQTASPWALMRDGVRQVFGERALRTVVLFGWLAIFYTVPEGIAAPYAAGLGGGPVATGLVLASTAFATMIGTPLFARFVRPRARANLMGPLAVLTCAALVLTALRPDLAVSLVIFSLSALFGIYQIAANTEFVARVPDERRAQAFGIASMGIVVGQGAGFIAAGAAASVLGPWVVIALWGAVGTVVAVALALRWRRLSPPGGRHAFGRRIPHAVTTASGLWVRRVARQGQLLCGIV
jgi:MFS family permease